ncbi:protein phosphatase CheZ [Methylobacterium sp. M6A4_1b]
MTKSPGTPAFLEEQTALLQHHLVSISEAIVKTRREIAELRQEQEAGRTRDELHAVVHSTEQATNTILTAAETVDTLARGIAARTEHAATLADAEAIQAQMRTVFEACNFQDLTGQRISKVVRTVVLVEERVAEMLRLWAGSAETSAAAKPIANRPPAPGAETRRRGAEDGLLNGPALPGTAAVSQDAVDAMFG